MSVAGAVIRSVSPRAILGAGTTLAVILLVQIAVVVEWLPSQFVPPPSVVVVAFFHLCLQSSFWMDVGYTLRGWAFGLGGAALIAVPLGLLIGSVTPLSYSTRLVVEFLRPVPSVALVPAVVLLLGVGFEAKVFLAVFGSVWPLFVNTVSGVRGIDRVKLETARCFRLSKIRLVTWVVFPATLPFILAGARISSAVALILSVTAELIIGMPGLGRSISVTQAGGAVAEMYALIVATGLLGIGINFVFQALERRALHWHDGFRT